MNILSALGFGIITFVVATVFLSAVVDWTDNEQENRSKQIATLFWATLLAIGVFLITL